ncbi:hypothetical protein SLS62_008635 [Diatrype stigma]|uniref:CCD97-like C-terminal domain-containing protein n=1 Tax=Diatrype stigma TaxID=117547 RepID=A0AAN9UIR4_9PEZI
MPASTDDSPAAGAAATAAAQQQPPPSSPASRDAYARPQPRPPKSPAHSAQIRVQNRRREWLERHPEYVDSLEHELADPILYDALIRRFQTPAEREKEGRTKGYSRVLEVDLLRGEARLAQVAKGEASVSQTTATAAAQQAGSSAIEVVSVSAPAVTDRDVFIREYAEAAKAGNGNLPLLQRPPWLEPDGGVNEQGQGKGQGQQVDTVLLREEGRGRWNDFLRRRFVLGRDEDFDYRPVDENDDYDAIERREEEDRWFSEEDPAWASEAEASGAGEAPGGRLDGETGVQDF